MVAFMDITGSDQLADSCVGELATEDSATFCGDNETVKKNYGIALNENCNTKCFKSVYIAVLSINVIVN